MAMLKDNNDKPKIKFFYFWQVEKATSMLNIKLKLFFGDGISRQHIDTQSSVYNMQDFILKSTYICEFFETSSRLMSFTILY